MEGWAARSQAMARSGTVFLLFALLSSGCAGGGTAETSLTCDGPSCGVPAVGGTRTAVPPVWAVGDWWNFTSISGGSSFSHVVSGDLGADWFMDTDNPTSAFRNAQDDTSYLGPVRKSDLAGSQGADRVEYLKWPLADNKTWTTRWDQQEVRLTAHLVTNDGTRVLAVPRFYVEARYMNGTMYAAYTYDPEVRWFSAVAFYDGRGEPQFGFQLANYGRNYPGNVVRWRLQTVVDLEGPLSAAGVQAQNFSVPADATDVWVEFRLQCTIGPAGVGVAPAPFFVPDETRGAGGGPNACPQDISGAVSAGAPVPPPTGGNEIWGWAINGSPATDGTYALTVIIRWMDVMTVSVPAAAGATLSR